MENETHSTHHHQSKSIQRMINTENEALLIWRYVPSSGSSMGINYYYLFYSFMVSSAGSFELGHYFWEERKNMNKQWSGIVMMILTKTIITIMSRLCRQTFLFHWPAMPEDSLQIVSFISEITILSSRGGNVDPHFYWTNQGAFDVDLDGILSKKEGKNGLRNRAILNDRLISLYLLMLRRYFGVHLRHIFDSDCHVFLVTAPRCTPFPWCVVLRYQVSILLGYHTCWSCQDSLQYQSQF